jgi:hypothetical protein
LRRYGRGCRSPSRGRTQTPVGGSDDDLLRHAAIRDEDLPAAGVSERSSDYGHATRMAAENADEIVTAIRKEAWEPVRRLVAGRVEAGHQGRLAATGGNLE